MRKVLIASVVGALLSAVGAHAQLKLGTPLPEDSKQLAGARQVYLSAKKSFQHKPTPKSRQAYVVATDRYAMISMTTTALEPKVKYPQALRLYREALKTDPTNHEAKNNSELIVSIYRSMHRPVPK